MRIEDSPSDINRKLTRRLGLYLFIIAWQQIVFYLLWTSFRGPDWLYLFDPRMGARLMESVLLDMEIGAPGVLSWTSAIMLLIIAAFVLTAGRGLKLYLAAESLLSVPTICAFAWIVITRIGSPEGFPLLKLAPPIAVFLAFSALPYGTAVRILAGSPADLRIVPDTRTVARTTKRTPAGEN